MGQFYNSLSLDSLKMVQNYSNPKKSDLKYMKDYEDFKIISDLYFSYDIVFKFIEEPFSNDLLQIGDFGLFNSCRFLINKLSGFNSPHQMKGVTMY